MTFRVETVFDLTHTCPAGHNHPDHPTDVDRRNWTCRICRQSVYIEMVDRAENRQLVERVPAREICVGDYLVYRTHAGIDANLVTGSNPHRFKAGRWYLSVENFGSDHVSPEQYVSRIPGLNP